MLSFQLKTSDVKLVAVIDELMKRLQGNSFNELRKKAKNEYKIEMERNPSKDELCTAIVCKRLEKLLNKFGMEEAVVDSSSLRFEPPNDNDPPRKVTLLPESPMARPHVSSASYSSGSGSGASYGSNEVAFPPSLSSSLDAAAPVKKTRKPRESKKSPPAKSSSYSSSSSSNERRMAREQQLMLSAPGAVPSTFMAETHGNMSARHSNGSTGSSSSSGHKSSSSSGGTDNNVGPGFMSQLNNVFKSGDRDRDRDRGTRDGRERKSPGRPRKNPKPNSQ